MENEFNGAGERFPRWRRNSHIRGVVWLFEEGAWQNFNLQSESQEERRRDKETQETLALALELKRWRSHKWLGREWGKFSFYILL